MSAKLREATPVYAILSDYGFWPFLLRVDEDLAAELRAACCPHSYRGVHLGRPAGGP